MYQFKKIAFSFLKKLMNIREENKIIGFVRETPVKNTFIINVYQYNRSRCDGDRNKV